LILAFVIVGEGFYLLTKNKKSNVTNRSYRMKSTALVVAVAAIVMFAPAAHARGHHYRYSHHDHVARHGGFANSRSGRTIEGGSDWTSNAFAYSSQPTYRRGEHGRPGA
jgi:hypothetical protein